MADASSALVATTAKVITVPPGNLFDVAAVYLGDGTQWNRIASLNGMSDPFFETITTLKLPPVNPSAGNGGILGA